MSAPALTSGFVLVGRGVLALACCKLLAARGLALHAVVSDDDALLHWARLGGIPCLPEPSRLIEMDWGESRPILLSVANEQLIPARVLELFAHAINFHDAPLPHYAGSHATSWALMARERSYAVSWHHMTSIADTGDVMLQVPVRIEANETALTLNAKCHEAALESFPVLLDRLALGDFKGRRQNPSRRKFFPRDRRPESAAILNWASEADELSALVRALSFGPYVNRLGLPKIWLDQAVIAVRRLNVCAERSTDAPGTVVSMTDESLAVATGSHDVALRDFLSLDGRVLTLADLATRFSLRQGIVLPAAGWSEAADSAAVGSCGWKDEAKWMGLFSDLKPVALPVRTSVPVDFAASSCVVLPARQHGFPPPLDAGDPALVVVLAYLARSSGTCVFDIGLRWGRAQVVLSAADALLADTRPFRVVLDPDQPFNWFRRDCLTRLAAWRSRKPYLRDAVARYPGVVRPRGWDDFCSWPISVELNSIGETCPAASLESPSALTFRICATSGQVTLAHAGLEVRLLDQLVSQMTTFAENCLTGPNTPLHDLALLPFSEHAALQGAIRGVSINREANTKSRQRLR
ncbi:MAG: formyltransferase family protein [Burkholderiaceae bacterium]|nr:formyltransferase family protein [Burkholderiaceae bacterium]